MDFIIDNYTLARGTPAMLELVCSRCGKYLMTYQKDGPGPLLRCYADRIHKGGKVDGEVISCPSCQALIGKKGIYHKEQRVAFFLEEGSVQIKASD